MLATQEFYNALHYLFQQTLLKSMSQAMVLTFGIIKLILLQPLRWCCVDCVIHHERDVREAQKYICVVRASNSKRACDAWSLLLLAAAVRSFVHMLLGISDRNKMVLWPGCGGRAEFSLHTKNVRSVWFVVKRKGCCCNLSGGVALIVWFTTNGMCAKNKICMRGASKQ